MRALKTLDAKVRYGMALVASWVSAMGRNSGGSNGVRGREGLLHPASRGPPARLGCRHASYTMGFCVLVKSCVQESNGIELNASFHITGSTRATTEA